MMHPDTELLVHLAANLAAEYPAGASAIALCKRMAITHFKTKKVLHLARKMGLIGVSGSGVTSRWASPERAAQLDEGRWTKRRLQCKAAKANRVAKMLTRIDAEELAPRRKAKLFVVNAPNSVFQLGEWMQR